MNVRETSIEAFKKIQESGLLTKLLMDHLAAFYELGRQCTARQAHDFYCENWDHKPNLNQFRSKVTLLVEHGALTELPEKTICPESKMRVTVYKPTFFVQERPLKLTKKERKKKIQGLLKEVAEGISDSDCGPWLQGPMEDLREIWRQVNSL